MEHDFIRYNTAEKHTPRMYNGDDFMANATKQDIDLMKRNMAIPDSEKGHFFLDRFETGKLNIDDPLSGYAYYPLRNLYCYATASIPRKEREVVSRPHMRVYTNKADTDLPSTECEIVDHFVRKYNPDCIKCAWDKRKAIGWAIITNEEQYRFFMEERPHAEAYCVSYVFIKDGNFIPLMIEY